MKLISKTSLQLFVLVILFSITSGCTLFRRQIITLCTNRQEMAAYVEYFNTLPTDYRVALCYTPNPADSVARKTKDADLILGPWLNGSEAARHLDSLERLFRKEYLSREDFYASMLNAGIVENKQILLPFSFNLPAVIFLSDGITEDVSNLVVSLEYMREKSDGFNESVRQQLVRMGFSPLWQPEFLYTAATVFETQFRETLDGSVHWNSARLQDMQGFCKKWIEEINLGYEQDSYFSRKYLYEPMPKLLDEGRILFYTADSSELFGNLEIQRSEADFRWLGSEHHIPVCEEVLCFAVPKSSKNKRGARLFLAWIFQPETQGKLLELNQQKRLDTFGLAGGFSSLRDVSERNFPQYYRQLLGRIPHEELLGFPKPLPVDWAEMKAEVVFPWFVDYMLGSSDEELLAQLLGEFKSENSAK